MDPFPVEVTKLQDLRGERREKLLERSEGDVEVVMSMVRDIVSGVVEGGDASLLNYTKRFDGAELVQDELEVDEDEISRAYGEMDPGDIKAIEKAAEAVERYHRRQVPEDWMEEFEPGVEAGQVVRPLESVGCYVPGGTAQYPSSVLMSAIPAKVAGVNRVVVCTPPDSNGRVSPGTLVASDVAGVDEVYRVGGAQAIAAMAYGTETVSRVEKIVGPGNVYVTAAKKIVSSDVEIDFMAGPSEILILADSSADPRLVALDLVAQAEHDPSSASVLVTLSDKLAEDVKGELERALEEAPRRKTAIEALKNYGRILIAQNLEEAIGFVNDYSAEHLQIMLEEPESVLDEIKNAGAIFIGRYSPTSAGDFAVGPSHILPTGRKTNRHDGINVLDFIRQPSVQKLSREGLEKLAETLERLAELEGLPAHARSIRERLEDLE